VVPPEGDLHWPPVTAGFFGEGRETENAQQSKKKIMKTKTKNSDSRLKNRTAQSGSQKTQLQRIDFKARFANRRLPVEKVLDLLFHETPRLFELAQVVGKWVWIQFEHRQPPTVTSELAQLGFHWNRKRQVWQHPCGIPSLGSHQDPRNVYRSYFAADSQTA
jgi:hypothetical protein